MRPELAPFVKAISNEAGRQTETTRECILPSGRASLWVILNRDEFRSYGDRPRSTPGTFVFGPDDRASTIELEAGRAHVWVEFTEAGAAAFFPVALAELRNDVVGLAELWGRDQLRERLLAAEDRTAVVEDVLLRHLSGSGDPEIGQAVRWIDSGASLPDVTSRLGLLPKTFRRRFVAHMGLTPKRYARVRRLQRVVNAIDGCSAPEWALVAAQHGYCDQAHLIDEFRDIVGATPGQYLDRRIDGPNHLRVSHDGPARA